MCDQWEHPGANVFCLGMQMLAIRQSGVLVKPLLKVTETYIVEIWQFR
jgi:hypothetical protein